MIRSLARLAAAACLAAGVGACGFSPVYGSMGAGSGGSGPIRIAEIDGRTGHFLRQELVRSVSPGVPGLNAAAELQVDLTEQIVRLGFAPDQAASRSDYVGTAQWTLRGTDGVLIANGSVREAASFNFADAAYADIAAQTAARERVATMLARSIRDQILFSAVDPSQRLQTPARVTTPAGVGSQPQLPTQQIRP